MFFEYRQNYLSTIPCLYYRVEPSTRLAWMAMLTEEQIRQLDRWETELPGFREFLLEVFARIYSRPTPIELNKVAPEAIWAVKFHQALDRNGIADIAAQLQGDIGNAMLYALVIGETFSKALPRVPKEHRVTAEEKLRALKQEEATLVELLKTATPPQSLGWEQDLVRVRERIAQLEALGVKVAEIAPEYVESFVQQIKDSVSPAAVAAIDKFRAILEASGGLFEYRSSRNGYSVLSTIPPEGRLELAKKLAEDGQLRRVARLIGRFRKIASGKRAERKTNESVEIIDGTRLGNELEYLNESELIRIADEGLEETFVQDYERSRLLLNKPYGQASDAAGPMAILLDCSDSMLTIERNGYSRWESALAMAIVLLQIAAEEEREASLVIFDSKSGDGCRNSAIRRQQRWEKAITHEEVMELASLLYRGGGTDFVEPLEAAIEDIETGKVNKDSHIVLITDGSSKLEKNWIEAYKQRLEQNNTKLHVLLVGGYVAGLSWADRMIVVSDFSDAQTGEIFTL